MAAVAGAVLVLPTLLDAYKLSEGQFDPLLDGASRTPASNDADAKTGDAPRARPGAKTRAAEVGRGQPLAGPPPKTGPDQPGADPADRAGAERARVGALTSELASAKRDATAQIASLEQRLAAERATSAALARDLAASREQVARGFPGRDAGGAREGNDDAARVDRRLRRAADPAVDGGGPPSLVVLSDVGPASAPPPDGLAAPAGPDAALAADGDVPASSAAADPSWTVDLPGRPPARVIVRYARGDGAALQRALALSGKLRSQGLDVSDPVDVQGRIHDGRVTYYYRTDRASAEDVAEMSVAPAPTRARLPAQGSPPRPGTIEVAVAD